eukprot:5118946-Prymnesium_polylepis.1
MAAGAKAALRTQHDAIEARELKARVDASYRRAARRMRCGGVERAWASWVHAHVAAVRRARRLEEGDAGHAADLIASSNLSLRAPLACAFGQWRAAAQRLAAQQTLGLWREATNVRFIAVAERSAHEVAAIEAAAALRIGSCEAQADARAAESQAALEARAAVEVGLREALARAKEAKAEAEARVEAALGARDRAMGELLATSLQLAMQQQAAVQHEAAASAARAALQEKLRQIEA